MISGKVFAEPEKALNMKMSPKGILWELSCPSWCSMFSLQIGFCCYHVLQVQGGTVASDKVSC